MLAMRTRFRTTGLALAFAIALPGCSTYNALFGGPPKLKIGDVRVVAEPDANRNSPVVIDVVLVADAALEQRLMAPDSKWFPLGPTLVASYPGALRVFRCEFPPASEMTLPPAMFDGRRALAVLVFAGLADGERRARIESWKQGGQITIGREGWLAAPQEKGQAPPRSPVMHCSGQA
jgi:hypothetical protein